MKNALKLMGCLALFGLACSPAKAGIVAVCVSTVTVADGKVSDLEPGVIEFDEAQISDRLQGTTSSREDLAEAMEKAACDTVTEGLTDPGSRGWLSIDFGRSGHYEIVAWVLKDNDGTDLLRFGVGFGDSPEAARAAAISDLQFWSRAVGRSRDPQVVDFGTGSF